MGISDEVRRALGEIGFHEVHLVTNFTCYRETDKGTQQVLVEILDLGSGLARYSCKATTEDGKSAYGNPAASLDRAITNVHWQDLDR
jgi:hypothetical protein